MANKMLVANKIDSIKDDNKFIKKFIKSKAKKLFKLKKLSKSKKLSKLKKLKSEKLFKSKKLAK